MAFTTDQRGTPLSATPNDLTLNGFDIRNTTICAASVEARPELAINSMPPIIER